MSDVCTFKPFADFFCYPTDQCGVMTISVEESTREPFKAAAFTLKNWESKQGDSRHHSTTYSTESRPPLYSGSAKSVRTVFVFTKHLRTSCV